MTEKLEEKMAVEMFDVPLRPFTGVFRAGPFVTVSEQPVLRACDADAAGHWRAFAT